MPSGRQCRRCGEPIIGRRSDAMYCSTRCKNRLYSDRRIADGRLAEQRERHAATRAAWQNANRARYNGRYEDRRRCRSCGTLIVGRQMCKPCVGKSARHRAARRRLDRAAEGTPSGSRVWVQGPCRWCGEPFLAVAGVFCSKRCKGRDHNARRRARTRGAEISVGSRHAVFVRDGWTCRICGDPVNREAKVPDLDAAVIDHVVPLAVSGSHDETNWQCAHFYCNSVKQDKVGFDFAPALLTA